jgi:hypothetical protein
MEVQARAKKEAAGTPAPLDPPDIGEARTDARSKIFPVNPDGTGALSLAMAALLQQFRQRQSAAVLA